MAAFERPGETGDPESWHRRPDGDGTPDRADQGADDRRGRRPETEAQAAERLGLSGLNRSDAYDSLRAKADAQEAEIRQRDTRARGEDRDGRRDEAADAGQREDEPAEPERDDHGSAAPRDAEMAHWTTEPTEDRLDRDPERHPRYWTEVPRFQANWERLEERWSRSQNSSLEGSPSGTRDRRTEMEPEQRTVTVDALSKIPEREPRISADVKSVEIESTSGARLAGFEFRLKGSDRLMEKVAERLKRQPERTPQQIIEGIHDAVRYTFCAESTKYTSSYAEVKGRLEDRGYTMYQCDNSWSNSQYKGVNTRWIAPEGQRFEIQFHTPESFHAKHEVTHLAYERLRQRDTDVAERRDLREFQRDVSSWIPIPHDVQSIKSYKKEGF